MEGNVPDDAAGHFDVRDVPVVAVSNLVLIPHSYAVLIEKRLEYNDFFAWFDEAHECAEHSFVRTRGDGDLRFWVYFAAEKRRVGFSDCFL